jgi:DNA mismatch endonuclease (patch repair protein)
MADKLTPAKRSWNMSRIKGKNTKPELLVRQFLFSHGIRYRIHTTLPGRPDIVIKKKRIVVFVNGCFWHGHTDCKDAGIPKSNTAFWQNKISGNVERDTRNRLQLEQDDWKVITLWECELGKDRETTLENTLNAITKS